jgi:peroxiredoxin Q/BCP
MKKIDLGVLNFELLDANDKIVRLADFAGKYIVLYFYPKDDTPGCTTEACSFRDANQVMKGMGVEVVGVSKDSVASHQKFLEKFKLNFTLLSDPEKKLQEAFGVWQKKKFMGREYMGTARTTFIIGPDGEILKKFENVKPKGHAQEVLNLISTILPSLT